MGTNHYGVDEKDLVIRPYGVTIPADKFCNAMRAIQKKAILVSSGVDEFTEAELFTLQMAGLFKDYIWSGGTHNTLPDDVIKIIHPNFKREEYFNEHSH